VPAARAPSILVDGRPAETLAVADRALQYGDGLFETFAVRDGEPRLWRQHMARLDAGCRRLGLPAPDSDLLLAEARELCAGHARAVLKLIYSSGRGGRGYVRPSAPHPSRIAQVFPAPEYPAARWRDGVAVRVCELRLARQPLLAGIKHLNRLEQVLARREWSDPDIAEGLLLDERDRVVEGTVSNVFVVRDGRLRTPLLDGCGVRGVMRERILELAGELGLPAEEGDISLAELDAAEEVFLSNSLIGIWPVARIGARALRPGPAGRALLDALIASGDSLAPESVCSDA